MIWGIGSQNRKALLGAVCSIGLAACATPAKVTQVEDETIFEVGTGQTSKPVQFRKIVLKMQRGEDIGAIQAGVLCVPQAELIYKGGRFTLEDDELTEAFRDELEAANYEVVGDPDALFEDPDAWKAEYLVAGLVKNLRANICFPYGGFGNFTTARGEAFMEVNWQIYSRLDRRVVYETTTAGSSKVADASPGGDADVYINAFAKAARNLLGDKEFYELLTEARPSLASLPSPEKRFPVAAVPKSTVPITDRINEIRLAVVTVFAGDGHGSGFFIDQSGYVLTNEHVVRTARFVKLKLATGREVLGEVLATNSVRDVALIKVENIGISPMPILQGRLPVGSTVYAVGSPLDDEYDTTVSRGVVSGYRVEGGREFIQSDANVLPGSSGGPLLDQSGNVVGLTASGLMSGGAPTGLNFFVPVSSAFERLGLFLEPREKASPTTPEGKSR